MPFTTAEEFEAAIQAHMPAGRHDDRAPQTVRGALGPRSAAGSVNVHSQTEEGLTVQIAIVLAAYVAGTGLTMLGFGLAAWEVERP